MEYHVEEIEEVFGELSSNDLATSLSEFFSGWDELSKDADNLMARDQLLEYGISLVDVFGQINKQLDQIQKDLDGQIVSLVDEINVAAKRIAELNGIIIKAELNGDNANDYRDELNYLIDKLSTYMDVDVSIDSGNMYRVSINGANLVNGIHYQQLVCGTRLANGTLNTVVWERSGIEVKLDSGKLLGLIEARGHVVGGKGSIDNGSPDESGVLEADVDADSDLFNFMGSSSNLIPEIRKGLNMLVSLLTRKVNAIHRSGIGLDGSTGLDFFVKINEDLPFEAGNIKVNEELEDSAKIAASQTGDSGDGSNANRIVKFGEEKYYQYNGVKTTVDDFFSLVIDWVGIKGQEAETFSLNQGTLVEETFNQKKALSEVSMDEEMSNLIRYQHAYNASAQVLNTMDGMLDRIINQMGLVGR